jgi:type IV pilus assembly protein PilO
MAKKNDLNLRNLDMNNPGSWPMPVKVVACVLVVLLVMFLAWQFMIKGKKDQLNGLVKEEVTLLDEFKKEQGRAANLEPLKNQLQQMELMLQQMLRQLPSKNQMPDLITDISQTALASGLTNELFDPGSEAKQEFYAELPIKLSLVGSYHQFGAFMSGVASLPRVVIMTMHDISLKPKATDADILQLGGTIKTYRYLDDEEVAEAEAAAAALQEAEDAKSGKKKSKDAKSKDAGGDK